MGDLQMDDYNNGPYPSPGTPATTGTAGTTPAAGALTPAGAMTPAGAGFYSIPKPNAVPLREDDLNLDSYQLDPVAPVVPKRQGSNIQVPANEMVEMSVNKKSRKPNAVEQKKHKGILKQIHPIAYVTGVLAVVLFLMTCIFAVQAYPH